MNERKPDEQLAEEMYNEAASKSVKRLADYTERVDYTVKDALDSMREAAPDSVVVIGISDGENFLYSFGADVDGITFENVVYALEKLKYDIFSDSLQRKIERRPE